MTATSDIDMLVTTALAAVSMSSFFSSRFSPSRGSAHSRGDDAAYVDRIAGAVRLVPRDALTTGAARVRRIKIFDTTLRDGEQSPGIALRPDEKAAIAVALEGLGVDVIEAGFAASSPATSPAWAAVSSAVESVTVASLCRTTQEDIDASAEALRGAPRSRLHIFLATSPIHMERKLGLAPHEVLERISWSVAYAAEQADEVEFSAEDATRSEPEFLAEACRRAITAGATVINLPDTVGYSCRTSSPTCSGR
jgi:isopropylmalate/homocitrate/citramalate synthase